MADLITGSAQGTQQARFCRRLVMVTDQIGYMFIPHLSTDGFGYLKTTDGGGSFGSYVAVGSGAVVPNAGDVWFDQWTPGDSGTKIHCWYFNTTTDDIFYRALDTNGDTLGSESTIFNGSSVLVGRGVFVSGTKTRSGQLYCAFDIDAGNEKGFYKSTDSGASWGTILDANFVEATVDECLLFPATGTGDNDDCWAIYQDASADQLTIKMWDSSAVAAIESASLQTCVENVTDGFQRNFNGAIRFSDGHLIVASFSEYNTATADFQVWDVSAVNAGSLTGITAKTAINTNVANTFYPSVFINNRNDDIYVAYIGKRDGTETLGSAAKIYYTKSSDGGSSWSSGDTAYSEDAASSNSQTFTPLCGPRFIVSWHVANSTGINKNNSVTFGFVSSLTGSLSFVGARSTSTRKGMTAAASFAGAAAKRTTRGLAGALSFLGSLSSTKLFTRAFTAALSFIGARQISTLKPLPGALSFVGATRKATSHRATAALSFIGAARKASTRALSGAITFAGSLANRNVINRAFTASLSFVGTTSKSARTAFSGALSFLASLDELLGVGGGVIFRKRRGSRGVNP